MVARSSGAIPRRSHRRPNRGLGSRWRPTGQHQHDVAGDCCLRLESQKKTILARERDRPDVVAKRLIFSQTQPTLDPARLVFLDESGFRLGSPPNYGWAPVGEKSLGRATHGDWCTMTMIGAIALDGWRGFVTIDAATDGDVFRAFVEQELVPRLRVGDVVVMDNLAAHQNSAAIAAIRSVGADVMFLPPYSPEFNPIESAWAKLKMPFAGPRQRHAMSSTAPSPEQWPRSAGPISAAGPPILATPSVQPKNGLASVLDVRTHP